MFSTLVESKRRRGWANERNARNAAAASVIAHAALIVAVARATAAPKNVHVRRIVEPILVWPKNPPPLPLAPRTAFAGHTGHGTTVRVPIPPLPIHLSLPPVGDPVTSHEGDLVSNATSRMGHPVPGPVGTGSSMAGTDLESDIDTPARPASDNPSPVYPSALRAAGVEGSVTAQFIVDTTGRVERNSITFAAADNTLFAASVRRALEQARFTPAEARGRKVRMLVQRAFVFRITR